MIPPQFDYVRPTDVGEVLRILRSREGEAKVLSGGYSLIPLLKLRLASPGVLVDLRDVGGLDTISESGGELRIGARVTHRRLLSDTRVTDRYPVFADAASGIGDPQVRNWGTIGGSVAHADPAADWPAVLVAVRATIVCRSVDAERTIAAREFFDGPFMTAIAADELLTEIRVPLPGPRTGSAYAKIERKAGDFSTAGAAAVVQLGADGAIAAAGLGLTAVADAAFAPAEAESLLVGARPDESLYRAAGEATATRTSPVADGHGPVDYKRAMAAEMVVRALRAAVARAQA